MPREYVRACQLTLVVHQVVDLNVLQVLNVPRTEPVLILNVLILALDHVVSILGVKLSTTVQYVAAGKVSLEILSPDVMVYQVSIILFILFLPII
jgi:hypothetical protein